VDEQPEQLQYPLMTYRAVARKLGFNRNLVAKLERQALQKIRDQLYDDIRSIPLLRDTYGHLIGLDQEKDDE
jgi:hypothetical protein